MEDAVQLAKEAEFVNVVKVVKGVLWWGVK